MKNTLQFYNKGFSSSLKAIEAYLYVYYPKYFYPVLQKKELPQYQQRLIKKRCPNLSKEAQKGGGLE